MKKNKIIGIISYFPDKEPDRALRIERFTKLLIKLDQLFPGMPGVIIAQNWGDFLIPEDTINKYEINSYGRLGILNARKTLREKFLTLTYDWMIMMDDDSIIDGDDSAEFLQQIDEHPDGAIVMCWEHSQFNMMAISKYIYERSELPDVDPEKGQGFEDVIFTSTLKAHFPDRIFTFKDCGLKEISFRYTGEDKVPSTWAGVIKRDWAALRGNTERMKAEIEGNAITDLNKIDLVVTYVDSTDPEWQAVFKQYNTQSHNVEINGKQRFRCNPHFVYLFRGVEKYAPWINNIFLVVQSLSQVPSWIDQEKVKIILHEDFIPKEYLPVFNSQAIEMFLHKIPGLSEKFLYSNDDTYFVGSVKPEDFYVENKVKTSFSQAKYIPGSEETMPLWKIAIMNSGLLVNKQETEKLKKQGLYISPMHGIRPYFKSKIEELHAQHSTTILNSISKFREPKNFTVYLYDFYLREKGLTEENKYRFAYFASWVNARNICTAIINPNIYKTICINDTEEEEDKKRIDIIAQNFKTQLPKLCKYEVER